MASQKNPLQIVRKDGKNCFVEVMSDSFNIEKVRFNFYTYDVTAQAGSKFTNQVNIYMSFEEFYRICHDITVTRALLSEILKLAQDAKAEGKNWAPCKVLCIGGKSADALAKSGQARPDGMCLSRQLKIQAGNKLPVVLIAESGPGRQDTKGLIVPSYQQPEQRVTIPFTYESIKELFLITKAHLDAFLAAKYTYKAFHPEENEAPQYNTTRKTSNYSSQTNNSQIPPPPPYANQANANQAPPPPPPYARQTNSAPSPSSYANQNNSQVPPPPPYASQVNNAQVPPPPPYARQAQTPPPPPPPYASQANNTQAPPPPYAGQGNNQTPPPPPPMPEYTEPDEYDALPDVSEEDMAFFSSSIS